MNPQRPRDWSTSRQRSWPPTSEDVSIYAVRRYALHAEIGAGSISTVHLGRLLGPERFARTVAVKRLRSQYAKDAECVSMLLDGARLGAGVRHSNVVPTLDVVTGDEVLVVTEYVHGESLAALLRTQRGRDTQAPLAVVSGVVVGLLRGLHAVQVARAEHPSGAPARARRYDIAPKDVLVGSDGVPRLIDLIGCSSADAIAARPVDDAIGGAVRDPVGDRSTVFSASVILWEALAGRPFLPRTPDGFEPPSRYRADLDPAVDAIVAKGLASAPAERFETAGEMAGALEATVPPATAAQIGEWVESLARASLDERERLLAKVEQARVAPSVRPPADTLPGEDPVSPPAPPPIGAPALAQVEIPASAPPMPVPTATVKMEIVTRRLPGVRTPSPSFETRRGVGPTYDASDDDATVRGSLLAAAPRRRRGVILTASVVIAGVLVILCARFSGGGRPTAHIEDPGAAMPPVSAAAIDPVVQPAPSATPPAGDAPAPSAATRPTRTPALSTSTPFAAHASPSAGSGSDGSHAAKPRRAPHATRDDVL